jgi:hypothetical protein
MRNTAAPDVTVSGSPSAVLRWAWNRAALHGDARRANAVTIDGDAEALAELRGLVAESTQQAAATWEPLKLAADHGRDRPEDPLGGHRAEETFEGYLDVLAPAKG